MNSQNVASDALTSLQSLKGEVLARIQSLAQFGDTTGLFKANDWLRNAVALENRYALLIVDAKQLIVSGNALLHPCSKETQASVEEDAPNGPDGKDADELGGKARGRECRQAFVKRAKQQGKVLTKDRGQLYTNSLGVSVGIGYGNGNADGTEWFIGLPAGKFKEAVLLCKLNTGQIQPFWLPRDFVEKYEGQLSVSRKWNQVKFNVVRSDNRFELAVPRKGPVDITIFADPEPMSPPPKLDVAV